MLKTASELVSEGWYLYIKNWRKFLPYLTILFVPTVILSLLGISSLYLSVYLPQSSLPSNLIIIAVSAASFVLNIWASIALTKALSAQLMGRPVEWKESFTTSNYLIWPVIYTSILMFLIVMGGFLLLIIPGIIFSVWYNFYFYSLVIENKKGLAALNNSKSLVVGRWWPIIWRLAVPAVVFGFLNVFIVTIISFLIKLIPLTQFLAMALNSSLTSLVGIIVAPFSLGASLILYYSAKQNPVMAPAPTVNPPKV